MCRNSPQAHKSRNRRVFSILKRIIMMPGLNSDAGRIRFWMAQLALVCYLIVLLTQIVAVFMIKEDTEKLFETLSVLSFSMLGVLKFNNLRSNYKQWFLLLLQLDNLELKELNDEKPDVDYESDDEDTEKCVMSHIDTYTKKFRSLDVNVSRVYSTTLIVFILSPFIELLYWKLQTDEILSYPHIIPGWSPLDSISFPGYLVGVAAEIIACLYTVMLHIAFDLIVFGVIIFLSGQFSLLRDLTKYIGGNGRYYDITARRDARARFRIKRCHHILVTLENSVHVLDKLVQQILGIYFLVITLTLCSVAIRLSSEQMTLMKILSLLQYTGASLIQLFLFCYYGDMLLHTSTAGMGEGVFASAWWRLSPRVRREALLLGIGQARVRRLRAGPFNKLDLPSFIQIIRAAYSYYAVLRK